MVCSIFGGSEGPMRGFEFTIPIQHYDIILDHEKDIERGRLLKHRFSHGTHVWYIHVWYVGSGIIDAWSYLIPR